MSLWGTPTGLPWRPFPDGGPSFQRLLAELRAADPTSEHLSGHGRVISYVYPHPRTPMQLRVPVLPLLKLVGIVIKDAPGGITADEWSEIGLQIVIVGEAALGLTDVAGPTITASQAAAHVDKVIAKHGTGHGGVLADLAGLFHAHAAA